MQKLKSKLKFFFKTFNFLLVFLTFAFLLLTPSEVGAADFKTDYQVEYNLSKFRENLSSNVGFNIRITNLRGDVYVNKFAISFPKSFAISNLKVSDDHGEISPKVIADADNTKVEMEFSNPNIGRDSVNNFYLSFDQINLFKVNGNVWEVAIPVIENKEDNYKVVVTLPTGTDKKISISKPKPDLVSGNQIVWDNPQTKTIYAVFGENQIYKAILNFHLKNNEIFPVITEVAFPPDSLYQRIFIESISPEPVNVYQDEDGNYLGKYLLKSLESKTVVFKGLIQVSSRPREEMLGVVENKISSQKNYLLSQQKYWTINSLEKINGLNSAKEIYDFTVGKLKYNYDKIDSDNARLGAEAVLSKPDQAVCMEFTDLFVGISREKGIMAREIEGYGFSYDPQLQPLSLVSDVLHAWPEFYDIEKNIWVPIDPTWENTSGIDYFTSFDLNHIVLAIHGRKSDYPLPAGMYKTGDSKDISIKATTETPIEKKSVGIENFNLSSRISDNKDYQGKFSIKNKSNVYLLGIPVEIKGENIKIDRQKTIVASLAPYEEKEINFKYSSSSKNKKNQGKIKIFVLNNKLLEETTEVIPFTYFVVAIGASSLVVIFAIFSLGKLILKKKKR
ncbi:MAG: hypothetical protein US40_C0014G0005 [Candidatus Roizmanbacteria bacterium GW2011_GWC2_37_13]|uniref:Transglutaminase-like domain-containing protein n=1 Tax=Candidatus Roizmanbacteria bacterium GW2011_GWC2_37_13 TaxID=1618486 RepID=A0A0G0GFB0_9BACT|nr:MAG: hypothetical protein US38_C0003G0051 [Candidatus Roizmanbacteria bacterium GW2011_GWC1_37_12]KKQ24720.1 MAG: hypothetical protein US40_C0014G0005 [Candidatus Roizmanbacteria bacterium GW2011_GWC2_37_13]